MPEAGVRIQYLGDEGKDEVAVLADMVVSPNPTRDFIRIDLPNTTEEIENLTLTDITGRTVNIKANGNTINLGNLPMGMYILSVESDVSRYTQKVQVVR